MITESFFGGIFENMLFKLFIAGNSYLVKVLLVIVFTIFIGCKSQKDTKAGNSYSEAYIPSPSTPSKQAYVYQKEEISKGAIRVKGKMMIDANEDGFAIQITDVIGAGPTTTFELPEDKIFKLIGNFSFQDGAQYVLDLIVHSEDNTRASVLKIVDQIETEE